MTLKKWIIPILVYGQVVFLVQITGAQCLISPMNASDYRNAECHDFQFQQAMGQVFSGYGSCGGLQFTSPLTDSDRITGITESEESSSVRIYPNPFRDFLFIESDDFQSGFISIYSMVGKLIQRGELHHDSNSFLDLSDLPAGAYLIRIILDDHKCSSYTIIKS